MPSKRTPMIELLCTIFRFAAILPVLAAIIGQGQVPDGTEHRAGKYGSTTETSLFLPAVTYPTFSFATSVAVADVNGDGRPDLLAAVNDDVAVLLGKGDGTFQAATTYGGLADGHVIVADINGDGRPDILVTNSHGTINWMIGYVEVLLGSGDGSFQPPAVYDYCGYLPDLIAVGDINGDGKADILVGSYGGPLCGSGAGGIGVMLGRGDGTFLPATFYDSGGVFPHSGAVADINGDGKLDLVVANRDSGTLGVLLGNGDGTFEAAVTYDAGVNPAVVVADVNADRKLDLIVTNLFCTFPEVCGPGKVRVLLGNGDGTFQTAIVAAPFSTDTYESAAAADVDGDGKTDVIAAGYTLSPQGAGIVDVMLGNGDGTFQPAISFSSGSDRETTDVKIADVNGDGKPDLLVAEDWYFCDHCSLGVLLNNTPSCAAAPAVTISTSSTVLWPPDGKLVPVTVSGTISEAAGCTLASASYAVADEYGSVQPSGSITVGKSGGYSFVVPLEASRLGNDLDGRLYSVTVSASNNGNKSGSQSSIIIVPHDRGH